MVIRSVCAWLSFTKNWIISIYHKELWDQNKAVICHCRVLIFPSILAYIFCNIHRNCIQSLSRASVSANEASICSNMGWCLVGVLYWGDEIWRKVARSIVILCAFSAVNICPLFLKEQRSKGKEDAHHQYVLERDFDAGFGSIACCSLLPFVASLYL